MHNTKKAELRLGKGELFSLFCGGLILLTLVVLLTAWATRHAIYGGPRFSENFKQCVLQVAGFLPKAKSTITIVDHFFPPTGVPNVYSNYLVSAGNLTSNTGYLLVPRLRFDGVNEVLLVNMSNRMEQSIFTDLNRRNSAKYSDSLSASESKRVGSISSRNRLLHPILMKSGLLVYLIPSNDLIAVDLKDVTEEKWRIRGSFHHSIETDYENNLWVCGSVEPGQLEFKGSKSSHSNYSYDDQCMVKFSVDGKILDVISVSDLIVESGLEYLLYGLSNPNSIFDPIHINQITPILSDSGVFRKGQLLISLRNLSTILLFDTNSRKIVWNQSGPWMNQHCVMFTSGSKFSVLDNHSFASGEYWLNSKWRTRLVSQDIASGITEEVVFNREGPRNFRIPVEGRALPFAGESWLIEDCLHGTVMIFKNQELIFKWSNKYPDGTVGITSWCRYLNESEVPASLLQN
jgi:hypothetical protein